jgi:hypothetical protein
VATKMNDIDVPPGYFRTKKGDLMEKPNPPAASSDAMRGVLKRNADDFQKMQETTSQNTRQKEKLAGLVASWAAADAETRRAFLAHIGVIAAEDLNASKDSAISDEAALPEKLKKDEDPYDGSPV